MQKVQCFQHDKTPRSLAILKRYHTENGTLKWRAAPGPAPAYAWQSGVMDEGPAPDWRPLATDMWSDDAAAYVLLDDRVICKYDVATGKRLWSTAANVWDPELPTHGSDGRPLGNIDRIDVWHRGATLNWSRLNVSGDVVYLAQAASIFRDEGIKSDPGQTRNMAREYFGIWIQRFDRQSGELISEGLATHNGDPWESDPQSFSGNGSIFQRTFAHNSSALWFTERAYEFGPWEFIYESGLQRTETLLGFFVHVLNCESGQIEQRFRLWDRRPDSFAMFDAMDYGAKSHLTVEEWGGDYGDFVRSPDHLFDEEEGRSLSTREQVAQWIVPQHLMPFPGGGMHVRVAPHRFENRASAFPSWTSPVTRIVLDAAGNWSSPEAPKEIEIPGMQELDIESIEQDFGALSIRTDGWPYNVRETMFHDLEPFGACADEFGTIYKQWARAIDGIEYANAIPPVIMAVQGERIAAQQVATIPHLPRAWPARISINTPLCLPVVADGTQLTVGDVGNEQLMWTHREAMFEWTDFQQDGNDPAVDRYYVSELSGSYHRTDQMQSDLQAYDYAHYPSEHVSIGGGIHVPHDALGDLYCPQWTHRGIVGTNPVASSSHNHRSTGRPKASTPISGP